MAVLAQDLRDAVLQAALQGKLTEQLSSDSSVDELLEKIKEEKEQLIKAKKIKKEKPLPLIEDDDKPFEIPSNWRWVHYSDIFYKITDGTHKTPNYTTSGIHFLSVKDMSDGKINLSNTKFISKKEHKELFERCNPEKGDLLVTKVGTTGIPVKVDIDEEFSLFVSVALLKFNHSLLNIDYLYYAIKSPHAYKQSQDNTRGVGNKNWVLDSIKSTIIPLPPIEEQTRIVARIEELMAKIDEYEKIENCLEEIKKAFPNDMKDAILQAAMQGKLTEQLPTDSSVDDLIEQIKEERKKLEDDGKIKKSKSSKTMDFWNSVEIPNAWKVTKLNNICDLYTGNSISESIKNSKYTNLKDGYNYIATKDVNFDNSINYENGIKIPFKEDRFVYSYPNSILMCIEGGSAGRKIAITNQKICFGNKLCTFNPICINYKFLYYYLQSPLFLKSFKNNLSGIISGVSLSKIKELDIMLPPLEEQERIVKILDKMLPLIENL